MAIFKIMIEIKGQLFDLWNCKSIQTGEEYNEKRGKMDYTIWLNKDAMILEYKDVKFSYDTKSERDNDLLRIKMTLNEHETAMVLWEDEEGNKIAEEEKEFDIDDEEDDDEGYEGMHNIDESIAPVTKMLDDQIKKKKLKKK